MGSLFGSVDPKNYRKILNTVKWFYENGDWDRNNEDDFFDELEYYHSITFNEVIEVCNIMGLNFEKDIIDKIDNKYTTEIRQYTDLKLIQCQLPTKNKLKYTDKEIKKGLALVRYTFVLPNNSGTLTVRLNKRDSLCEDRDNNSLRLMVGNIYSFEALSVEDRCIFSQLI